MNLEFRSYACLLRNRYPDFLFCPQKLAQGHCAERPSLFCAANLLCEPNPAYNKVKGVFWHSHRRLRNIYHDIYEAATVMLGMRSGDSSSASSSPWRSSSSSSSFFLIYVSIVPLNRAWDLGTQESVITISIMTAGGAEDAG